LKSGSSRNALPLPGLALISAESVYARSRDVCARACVGTPPTLAAGYPGDGQAASAIGKLLVPGVGEITILPNRSQGRLLLKAMGTDGVQLGRAESVAGLGDTVIYVRSPKGLMKLVIHWKT
jgi:hypothetical protein